LPLIGWFFAFLAAFGGYLNAKGLWVSFIVWIITNMYFMVNDLASGNYPESFLFLVNILICSYGIFNWNTKEPVKKKAPPKKKSKSK
jgi:nicotinamide riboside transporter PnuC